jgi:hypothetical protein
MRKLFSFMAVSVDGYHATLDRNPSWQTFGPEFADYSVEQLDEVDTLVFGRTTYEELAAYWTGDLGVDFDPRIAERMNRPSSRHRLHPRAPSRGDRIRLRDDRTAAARTPPGVQRPAPHRPPGTRPKSSSAGDTDRIRYVRREPGVLSPDQFSMANSCHSPGTPLRWWCPRLAQAMSDPISASRTV